MDNEIVITIKSDDDSKSGFDSARREADKFKAEVGKISIDSGNEAGKKIADGLTSSLSGGLKTKLGDVFSESIPQAALPVVAALAPTMGSLVAAGIIGGASLGGVIGGIVAVSKDPAVAGAGADLGKKFSEGFTADAKSFVKPVLSSIQIIGAEYEGLRPKFQSIFKDASRYVAPLTHSLTSGIGSLVDGVQALVSKGGPVVEAFGGLFEGVSKQVGETFSDISEYADEGAVSVRDLGRSMEYAVAAFGKLIQATGEAKGASEDFDVQLDKLRYYIEDNNVFAQLGYGLDLTADGYDKGSEAAQAYRDYTLGVADAADMALLAGNSLVDQQEGLTTASDDVTISLKDQESALQTLNEAYLAQTDPAFTLLDAMQDVTEAQRDYNKAVKKSGEESPAAAEALRELAIAAGKVSSAAGETGEAFTGEMTPAMQKMLTKAGLSKDQIAALKKQLKEAKKAADDWEGTFTQRYVVKYSYQGRQAPVGGGYENSPSYGADRASGGIAGAAVGGLQNGLRWVGEQGPELIDLPASATVHSAADSQRMMRQAYSGGSGPSEVILSARPGSSRDLMSVLIESLQYECRTQYGGSAQRMIGQPGVLV